jgi:assimilatory nitrate reductase catalytic subunit
VACLLAHTAEPQLALHSSDANALDLKADDLVRLRNFNGVTVLRAVVSDAQQPGAVFAPMHWNDQFSSSGAIDALVHDRTDPHSGQPDLKASRVHLSRVPVVWVGFLLRRSSAALDLGKDAYWSKVPASSGFAFQLAGWSPLQDVIASERDLRRLLAIGADVELASYSDPKREIFRYAALTRDRLEGCVFLAPSTFGVPSRDMAVKMFGKTLQDSERLTLLAGHDGFNVCAGDTIVCSCFAVGAQSLNSAIRSGRVRNISEIGSALQAGTNCGSCVPELKRLLADAAAPG